MESSVDNHICPDEEYLFRYTESELKEVESHMLRPLYRYLYICVPLLLSSLLSFLLSDNKPILWAVIIGVVFFADFLTVMLIIRGKRMYASSNPRVISSVYEYKFYKDHFVMIIHRDNEIIRQSRHAYNEWSKIINTDKYILFVLAGQLSIIKKDQLIENSILYSFLQGKDEKQNQEAVENTGERSKATGSLRTLSIVLFICTLAALYLAVFAVAATSGFDDMYMENMWIFFLFTPISIASIVVGFILKARGVSYKKNIIAGFIMTAVLCIFGCFVFIFGGMYSNSDALLLKTEQ